VATPASPAFASAAAIRLERVHAQLAALGFTVPAARTEVMVFADVEQMRPYSPGGETAGFFQQGAETSFIAVAWEAADPYRALAHEAAHQAMASVAARHPPWLREGLAELLSNLEPAEGGLKLGSPIAAHIDAARNGPPRSRLYAQHWMQAHHLVVGRPFEGTLAHRLEALQASEAREIPLPENFPVEILPAAIDSSAVSEVTVRPLASWEWEHRLAELLRARNRAAQAREALLALRARFPEQPEPAESLGALEMDTFQYDLAEQWLAEAARKGSTNPWTHYRYSLLLLRPEAGPEERARRALDHARRASEADPAQPLYWLARAHAEMQVSQWEAARASLAQLKQSARDPLLVEQVRVELEEIERRREQQRRGPPQPAPPERPPAIVAAAPEPPASISPPPAARPARPPAVHPGTLTFWGYLRRVDCGENEKVLTVSNRVFSVRVRERVGARARVYSPPRNWRGIPCTLKNVEVNVIYRPAAQFGPINGDLVALVF
jgi:tetratricopeptide (TPR) repeat protein